MPKLHDLCQQFWEEIAATSSGGGTIKSAEEIIEIAYARLKESVPRDADVLKRHLEVLSSEMDIQPLEVDGVEQLTESLFG